MRTPDMDKQAELADLIKEAQALVAKKDEIEAQIRELHDTLQGVGMDEPLVDRSGFPRSDIDVAAVRTSRHMIHCLRNDHKDIMKAIEQALHAVHEAQRKTNKDADKSRAAATTSPAREQPLLPFAIVNAVAPDSPADQSGLLRGDKLLRFGSVHKDNHDRLQALNRLVSQSEGIAISVTVLRENSSEPIQLSLTPRSGWGGRGTLGCHILPIQ